MYSKTVVQLISNCFVLVLCEVFLDDLSNFPDYDNPLFLRSKDVRQNFIKNKKRHEENARKIKLLDQYLPNNTVYVDEIAHYQILKNSNPAWKKVNEFETEFRNLIAMRGLKYTYRRDTFWRTWRLVHYPKNDRVINYLYKNSVNFTKYDYSGYWIIEEKPPPCPFELFSLTKENKICALHLNQYHDVKKRCGQLMNLSDITGACDNPILTEWFIEKSFNDKLSERIPSVICEGRESCTITTLYEIAPDHISFRIVNATNDVIYSRIMKPDKNNYACIKDCGKLDPYIKTITSQNSLRINLLSTKNKREDEILKTKQAQSTNNKRGIKTKAKSSRNQLKSSIGKFQNNYHSITRNKSIGRHYKRNNFMFEDIRVTPKSETCKALKSLVQDEMDEYK